MIEHCQNSAEKYSIEQPILLSFVNLSTVFCPKLQNQSFVSNLLFHFEFKALLSYDVLLQREFEAYFPTCLLPFEFKASFPTCYFKLNSNLRFQFGVTIWIRFFFPTSYHHLNSKLRSDLML